MSQPLTPSLENGSCHNFNAAIKLTHNLVKTFHPLLGLHTESVVNITSKANHPDFFSDHEFEQLQLAAWLHNIGLLSLPRELVSRALEDISELDPDELSQFKKHPIYAQEWTQFNDHFQDVSTILRATYERWDGSGYPDNSTLENIPKPARFLAVCAHYAQSPKSQEETIQDIIDGSGSLFNPEAVRLFLKVSESTELPHAVKELLFSELQPGMTLAHPIHTPTRVLLFPADEPINDNELEKIQKFNDVEPIHDRILIYTDK